MAQKQSVLPGANDLLQLAARPVQVIEHPGWIAARDAALALLAAGPCVVVLLGPPGSGKTMLLRNLEVALAAQGRTACLLDFGDSQRAVGLAEIVLVDEADRISAARLDELALCEHGARALVLAALPAAGERFRRHPGAVVIEFAPLSPDQACGFVVERLAQLGLPVWCLTEAAWAELVAHGRGVPRLLIALLGLALFVAAEDDAEQVTGAHVDQAVAVRSGDTEPAGVGSGGLEPNPAATGGPAASAASAVSAGRRSGWLAPVTAALLMVCLLVPGTSLIGDRNQEIGQPGPRNSGAQSVAQVKVTTPAAVAPKPIARSAQPVAVGPPQETKTADAAPSHPASAPAGPITPKVDVAQQPVPPTRETTRPMVDSTATVDAASQPAKPPVPAISASVASSAPAPTAATEAASQPAPPPVPATAAPAAHLSPAPAAANGAVARQASPAALVPIVAATMPPKLPAGALIHIVLIYPRGDNAAEQRGRGLAQVLRSAGLGVGDPFPVASRAAKRGISYYFNQDEGAAGEIGRRLDGEYGDGKLVRPPRGAGLPRPGTIEISVGSG